MTIDLRRVIEGSVSQSLTSSEKVGTEIQQQCYYGHNFEHQRTHQRDQFSTTEEPKTVGQTQT